jgi:DNA-binding response OmpR family regulator
VEIRDEDQIGRLRQELTECEARVRDLRSMLHELTDGAGPLPSDPGETSNGNGHSAHLSAADLEVDLHTFRATRNGHTVPLTITELKLLAAFMSNPDGTLSREQLLNEVWGYEYVGDSRLVDMAVKRLRDKLGNGEGHGRLITTVRGLGYRFDTTDPEAIGD